MQVTQTSSEGLKQAYKVVVESKDIDAKVSEKLADLSQTARLPGFRPGKVPTQVLRQRFGKSVLGEVLQQAIDDSVRKTIEDKALKPALQPKIEVTSFDEGKDLEYTMEVEVLPEITPGDFSGISLERLTVEVSDAEVEDALQKLAGQQTLVPQPPTAMRSSSTSSASSTARPSTAARVTIISSYWARASSSPASKTSSPASRLATKPKSTSPSRRNTRPKTSPARRWSLT
jgi:hypothetical protein